MRKIIKDLSGQRFGRLLILSYEGQNKHRQSVWKCQCDCGTLVRVARPRLVSGNTTSCGCYNKEILSLPVGESSWNKLFSMYKRNAERRNLVFHLSKEEFRRLATSNCYYCNSKPSNYYKNQRTSGGVIYSGIDRVDSSRNYVLDNCVPCCSDCNYAKRKMSIQQFIDWISRISNSEFFLNKVRI